MMEGCPVLRRVLLKLRGVDAGAAMEPATHCAASFDGEVLVLAKLKGFPWWPAVDKGAADDGRRIISFFAWHGQYSLLEDSCVRAFECQVSPPPCLYLKKKRKLLDLYLMALEEAQEWPRQKAEEMERARKPGSSAATNKSVPARSSLRPSKAPAVEEGTPPRQEKGRLKSGGRRGTKRHSPPHTSRTPGSETSIASSCTDEPLRNSNPEAITEMGFVEIPGLLSGHLCYELASLPMTGAEGISNAFQKDLPEHLREQVIAELSANCILRDAVRQTFGTERYAVQTTKVLMTEFGAEPQIPHADDYCNRILFGVAHLLPEQPSTEAMPYRSEALYPTGLLVQCDECSEWRPLPDKVARYRAHTQHFNCSDGNFRCVEPRAMEAAPLSLPAEYHDFTAPNSPTLLCERDGVADASEQQPLSASTGAIDIQEVAWERKVGGGEEREGAQEKFAKGEGESWTGEKQVEGEEIAEVGGEQEDDFARGVCEAFSDLLWRPDELMESMRPLGVPNAAGDAVVALPTLIHRGPGGNDEHAKDRLVLFFTVQPLYSTDDELVGTYDPEAQIHAGWIMWRAWELLGEERRDLVIDNYRKLGYDLQSFGQGGKIFWEDEEMQSRRKKRKADGKHCGEKASHRQIKFDEELHE